MKVARGNDCIYFYAQTAMKIQTVTDANRMALYIATGSRAYSG